MEVKNFVNELEKEFGPCHRKISYSIIDGKKIQYDGHKDQNNLTSEQIKSNRGSWKKGAQVNCYSIHNLCMKDVFTIDFDSKSPLAMKSKLKKILDIKKTYYTETAKGFHYYCKMPDFPWNQGTKLNQQKVGAEGFELDLLKMNCSWENNDRKVYGDNLAEIKWNGGIDKFFDLERLKIRQVGEKNTPVKIVKVDKPIEDDFEVIEETPKCDKDQFVKYLDRLGDHRYDYESWIKVGMACHNNFEGLTIGFSVWSEWSAKDPNNEPDIHQMCDKWKSFDNYEGELVTYRSIKCWADMDMPGNNYKDAYMNGGEDKLVDLINEELCYCIATSEFLHIHKEDWLPKKQAEMVLYYSKYIFFKDKEKINPFRLWCEHIKQRRVDKIVFDPQETKRSETCFNLWTGYEITSQSCRDADINDCDLILEHINRLWCKYDERQYNYILDWFASKLQKPWIKLCSVPVFQSLEGSGKNIILDLFYKIMSSKYFMAISNPLHILGAFNGMVEGKLLVDLNEVSFGGNITQNNQLKSLITEPQTIVNKKNKEAYEISNLCDYIITTNCEWAISVGSDNRRYNCYEMDNWLSGNHDDSPEKTEYTKNLLEQTQKSPGINAFAKYLYDRDISGFNPRIFKRTAALKFQIEQGWTPIIKWIHSSLENNCMSIKLKCKWNDFCRTDYVQLGIKSGGKFYYFKDELYRLFNEGVGQDKHNNMSKFYAGIENMFKSEFQEFMFKGKTIVKLPDMDVAKQLFRENQLCEDYFNENTIPDLIIEAGNNVSYGGCGHGDTDDE